LDGSSSAPCVVILLTQQEVGVKRGEEKRVQAVHLDKVREGVQAVHLHKVGVKGAQEKVVQVVHLHKVGVKGAQEEGVQAVKGKDKVRVKALQLHKVEFKIAQEEGVKAVQLLHKVGVKKTILVMPIYCPFADLVPNLVCQVPKFGTKGKEKCIMLMLKHMRIVVKFGTMLCYVIYCPFANLVPNLQQNLITILVMPIYCPFANLVPGCDQRCYKIWYHICLCPFVAHLQPFCCPLVTIAYNWIVHNELPYQTQYRLQQCQ